MIGQTRARPGPRPWREVCAVSAPGHGVQGTRALWRASPGMADKGKWTARRGFPGTPKGQVERAKPQWSEATNDSIIYKRRLRDTDWAGAPLKPPHSNCHFLSLAPTSAEACDHKGLPVASLVSGLGLITPSSHWNLWTYMGSPGLKACIKLSTFLQLPIAEAPSSGCLSPLPAPGMPCTADPSRTSVLLALVLTAGICRGPGSAPQPPEGGDHSITASTRPISTHSAPLSAAHCPGLAPQPMTEPCSHHHQPWE